jgi:hypothetical protein
MYIKTTPRHIPFNHLFCAVLFLVVITVCKPVQLYAQEATITDFTVSNSENQLLLYLTVKDCFTDEMETAIHNGIPATFTFYVDLYQLRKAWPDKKIASLNFNHIMGYDSLKKEYQIRRAEKNDNKLTSSLEEAKNLMSEINDFQVFSLEQLDIETSYKIKVKAKLAKKTLPLYFHYLIPFSSLWDFETDWYELIFHF